DFERILKTHRASLMGDPFIKLYIDDILRTMRTQVLLKAIAPYTRVKLPYLAGELNDIPVTDVEDLLVSCILDGKVDGKIDQVRGLMLLLGPHTHRSARTAVALERWAESLRSLNTNIAAKVDYR
ncbi:unnamed protein product, partial [Ectocarpus sp. 12 AP-2014]